MILIDTSAWVEFLRGTGSAEHLKVRSLINTAEAAITEVVMMELLAGIPDPAAAQGLRSRLRAFPLLRVQGLADYEEAAALFRECRAAGYTVRSLIDCIIAAVAIREGASVLHKDSDFDSIAEVTTLRIEAAS